MGAIVAVRLDWSLVTSSVSPRASAFMLAMVEVGAVGSLGRATVLRLAGGGLVLALGHLEKEANLVFLEYGLRVLVEGPS